MYLLISKENFFFKFQPIRNKNCSWRPYFVSNQNEIRISYRGPSIDASCKILLYLVSGFRSRFLEINQPETKNCLWRPCSLMDRDKMSNFNRGPSIDSFYQVSVHLAKWFQRKIFKCEKLTDGRWRTTSNGKCSDVLLNWWAKNVDIPFDVLSNLLIWKKKKRKIWHFFVWSPPPIRIRVIIVG